MAALPMQTRNFKMPIGAGKSVPVVATVITGHGQKSIFYSLRMPTGYDQVDVNVQALPGSENHPNVLDELESMAEAKAVEMFTHALGCPDCAMRQKDELNALGMARTDN